MKETPPQYSAWSYAPSVEPEDHARLKKRYGHFINGKFIKPAKGKYFTTSNPATLRPLTEVAEASVKDVDAAVSAARNAYRKSWGKMVAAERGKYLFRIARKIQEQARELAVTETMDGGKPIRESRDFDIPAAAAHFFYYAGWADKLEYAFPGRQPKSIGVAAQVIPWNFPLLMAAWKIAPALAAGNTVVLKPAETTPLTALKLAEIIEACELPPGTVNIITGGGDAGRMLVSHREVNKVAFTGSTEVGKQIQRALAGSDKKLTLELGGKAAHIITEDAAIDQAVEGIVNGIFFNQGHVCCAGSRLYIQEGIASEVIEKLRRRMELLIVGNPLDKNTDIGAINSREQLEKIRSYVHSDDDRLDIYQPECTLPESGYFFKPTLISGAAQSHRVMQEEIFGPVLAIQTFRTIEEVIEKANNTPFGLSAGIWCDKGARIFHFTSKLKAGVIWANTYNKFDPASPFGGFKESGFGREGGIHGLAPYLSL